MGKTSIIMGGMIGLSFSLEHDAFKAKTTSSPITPKATKRPNKAVLSRSDKHLQRSIGKMPWLGHALTQLQITHYELKAAAMHLQNATSSFCPSDVFSTRTSTRGTQSPLQLAAS